MTLDSFLASVERRAFRMAQLATRSEADALDIVQDAMLKLVQNYRDSDSAQWLMLFQRILQNKILDWHRRQTRLKRLFWWQDQDNRDDEDPSIVETNISDPVEGNPAHLLAQAKDVENVMNALADLPLRQQQAFLLRAWEGYDVASTAEIMACSTGSVKTHYFRATTRIRKLLENSYAPA